MERSSLQNKDKEETVTESVPIADTEKDPRENQDDDGCFISLPPEKTSTSTKRRTKSVIDSNDAAFLPPEFSTPVRSNSEPTEKSSPDEGYSAAPEVSDDKDEKKSRKPDQTDAHAVRYDESRGIGTNITVAMSVQKNKICYNMNHRNRGKCVIFNHEIFETGYDKRPGSTADAKRIYKTFSDLGFTVETHDNLSHSEVIKKITELSKEDYKDSDCICVFVLTHGLSNDLISAKDAVYKSDNIWKPFTADQCTTLAGKPKLFFFQACRGDQLDGGVLMRRSYGRTETDSVAAYKIPTHADFLIAHSTVQGFLSWRHPEEGTWYIQCLCNVIDEYWKTTDLLTMLTITSRKVALDYTSFDDINPAKHEQKQVPSVTTMLIRDIFFTPKEQEHKEITI